MNDKEYTMHTKFEKNVENASPHMHQATMETEGLNTKLAQRQVECTCIADDIFRKKSE